MQTITAEAEARGQRLDVWLARRLAPLSRSRVQALLADGCIRIDGQLARPNASVRPGMRAAIDIPPPAPARLTPEPIPLRIIYEDDAIVVINKPPGLVVHPAPGHAAGTLVHALLHHCADLRGIGGERRPGLVHRLDKDTSGVMVAAKRQDAMTALTAAFKARHVDKCYRALVKGCPMPPAGRIETAIGRSHRDRKKMAVTRGAPHAGRPAITEYAVEATCGATAALLRIVIHTGRTHQIRVHMAHLGHPVLGDAQYGRASGPTRGIAIPRQMLHAAELAFAHPLTGQPMRFEAPLPPDMRAVYDALRQLL